MAISAFQSAAAYFQVAIGLVSSHTWKADQKFCIDLYSAAAEAEHCSGGFEQVKLYYSRIMQLVVPPVEKLRICFVMLNIHWVEEQPLDAVKLGTDILSEMGCHLPRRTTGILFKTITGLMAAKRYVKILTPEYIDKLPLSTDPVHNGIMRMLEALVYPCHMAKQEIIPLLCIQMIQRTLKKGVTPLTPYAFGFLGFILAHFMGDFDGGQLYMKHAFALLKKYDFREVEPRTRFMINAGLVHWVQPWQNMMHSFVDIYEMGMRAGDCETATMSIYYYLDAALYTGRDLESIDEDCDLYMKSMADFNQQKSHRYAEITLQAVRNLRGKSSNTTKLTGSVMVQEA